VGSQLHPGADSSGMTVDFGASINGFKLNMNATIVFQARMTRVDSSPETTSVGRTAARILRVAN